MPNLTGTLVWGPSSAPDTSLVRGGAGLLVVGAGGSTAGGSVTTGPGFGGFTGTQTLGTLLNGGGSSTVRTFTTNATDSAYTVGTTADTQPRFQFNASGSLQWGPGGSTAVDTTFGRLAAGVLGNISTSLSTGPTSRTFTGSQAVGSILDISNGLTCFNSVGFSVLTAGLTTDTQARFVLNYVGQMQWGVGGSTATDTTMARLAAGVLGMSTGSFSTGPLSVSFTGTQSAGVFIGTTGNMASFGTAAYVVLATGLTTDTVNRFNLNYAGQMQWGPGGSAAVDVTFTRAGVGRMYLQGVSGSAIRLDLWTAAVTDAVFAIEVVGDTQPRWYVDGGGIQRWGPGGSTAIDTSLQRSLAGVLNVNAKTVEAHPATVSQAAGTTWTPTYSNGLVQRVNITSAGTVTIGSPGVPPTNTSCLLVLIIHNASGGTLTLSWNAVFSTGSLPAAPINGQGDVSIWTYNTGTAKWCMIAHSSE